MPQDVVEANAKAGQEVAVAGAGSQLDADAVSVAEPRSRNKHLIRHLGILRLHRLHLGNLGNPLLRLRVRHLLRIRHLRIILRALDR